MATLGSLVVELGANVGKLQADMARATSVVDRASAGIQRAAGLATAALAGIGAGLSLAAITGAARQVVDLGDRLRDLAFATGLSVEQLSFLEFAAGQLGTSVDTIANAAQRLSRNLIDVANGSGEQAARALTRLGLSAAELARQDLVTQLASIGDALAQIDNPTERAAAGAALLGRSYGQLAPLLLAGGDALQGLTDRFVELGGVITTGQAEKFDAFNDSLGELQLAVRQASEAIATALAPALTSLFTSVASTLPQIGPFFTDAFFGVREVLLDASRAVQRSKLDFLEFFNVFGVADNGIEATRRRILEITEQIRELREARDGAIILRAEDRRTQRQQITAQVAAAPIEVNPEAAAKAAAAASREAERAAAALQRESDSVRAFLQDYARDRERAFAQEVEASRQRVEQLRESIATPRERALAELREFEAAFGANSEEYGRKAVEVFNELEGAAEGAAAATSQLDTAAADLGLTFSSAFEDAIVNAESLGDIVRGLADDILRITARTFVTEPLTALARKTLDGAGGLSGLFSSIFGGFRANGGPVVPGRAYVVGERGPELLVPGTAGSIVPNGGGGGVTIINNTGVPFNARDRGTVGGRRTLELGVLDALAGAVGTGAGTRELGLAPGLASR
jgi:uncharacterized protein YukE